MARASGAHDDIRRQMGGDPAGAGGAEPDDDFDRDLGDWKSNAEKDRDEQDRLAAMRRAHRAQERARIKAQNTPPATSRSSTSRRSSTSTRTDRVRRTAGARRSSSSRRRGKSSFSDPTGGRLPITFDGDGLGGLFIGAVVYALVLSVVDFGAAGPGMWFKAKFLNQVSGPGASTSAAPAGTSKVNLA